MRRTQWIRNANIFGISAANWKTNWTKWSVGKRAKRVVVVLSMSRLCGCLFVHLSLLLSDSTSSRLSVMHFLGFHWVFVVFIKKLQHTHAIHRVHVSNLACNCMPNRWWNALEGLFSIDWFGFVFVFVWVWVWVYTSSKAKEENKHRLPIKWLHCLPSSLIEWFMQ